MARRFSRGMGFGLAWVGATAVAVIVAAAAVGSVRSQVTDVPTPLGSPQVAALAVEAPSDDVGVDADTDVGDLGTAPVTDDAAAGPDTSTTTVVDDVAPSSTTTTTTIVTSTAPPGSTTTTTQGQPESTTTTTVSDAYTRTYDTIAGSVRVRVEGTAVTFAGAFPLPGWSVDLKNAGPERVEVEFEENEGDTEVEFSAELVDGELVVEIDVE